MKRLLLTFLIISHSSFLIPLSSFLFPRSSFLVPPSSFLVPRSSFLVPRPSFLVPRYSSLSAQPRYDYARLHREHLGRGVVAVRTTDGRVFVSWRTLRSDPVGQPYDVYRNGTKLNDAPLTTGGTCFIDEHPLPADSLATYEVRTPTGAAPISHLSSFISHLAPTGYLSLPLHKPDGRYVANDVSVGDVDGDGEYELFLKWEPWNAHDNAHDGFTDPVLIDCYRLPLHGAQGDCPQSSLLWRINLGKNIRAGAHYTQFMVYDFDGDGRAELICRTADGSRDALGHVIGDSLADYRNAVGRIVSGPDYLTVFDGLTGRALDTKPYVPQRGDPAAWGDAKANRSDRFLAAVAYLGNETNNPNNGKQSTVNGKQSTVNGKLKTASAVFCRGYYTRSVLAAWDWDGRELRQRWVFDTDEPRWAAYAGQGNHNLRVADVDGDGLDEITYGAMCVDHDGTGLYTTGFGHGDALHLLADPQDGQLYIWDCHENRRDGSELRNARTGEVVFQLPSPIDVGRCMAADVDPTSPGPEMWSIDSRGVYNMKGEKTATGGPLSINFGVWWDGDLLRELLDRQTVTKYDWEQRTIVELQRFDGQFNNGTKSNPCLCADILGDWREEVIVRNRESTELRIYVSTIPTPYRIDCLMEDIPYRLSVATQNVAYNQPSEPGFYLGPDRTDYLK